MTETIPGCTSGVVWIEDAGHAPFLTRPEAINKVLRAVVRAVDLLCGWNVRRKNLDFCQQVKRNMVHNH